MPPKGRVVVTGASGLVASGVIKELQLAGYDVVGLSRRDRSAEFGVIPWIQTDLAGGFEAHLDRYLPLLAVVHLGAAIVPPAGSALTELRTVNMEASERLFHYCGERDIDKVVFTSSLGVLARPLRQPIMESDPVGPVQPYHLSKYWGELALREAASRHGYVGVSLRISSPVSRRFDRLPETVVRKWLTLAAQGRPISLWGQGSRTQDFVAVEDIGRAVVLTLGGVQASDVVHLGGGRQTSMRELAEAIAALGRVEVRTANPVDPNENERWDLDLSHARQVLDYAPRFTVLDYLPVLWEQALCAVR